MKDIKFDQNGKAKYITSVGAQVIIGKADINGTPGYVLEHPCGANDIAYDMKGIERILNMMDDI